MNNGNCSARMLLVSRESSALGPLWAVSKINSWQLEIVSSGLEALDRLEFGPSPDLVLVDLAAGDTEGLHTLRWLRRTRPELSIILLSDPGENEHLREAVRLGTHGCFMKPYQESELERTIKLHLNSCNTHCEAEPGHEVDQIIGDLPLVTDDPTIQKLRARAEQLAKVDGPVLLLGDSSNSKEIVGRLIHKLSARSGSEFLKVNCAGVAPEVLEHELFGDERPGSSRRKGKFELCQGGSLLLDGITQMPLSLQADLLHFLENNKFLLRGERAMLEVDVRVFAAVNVDVEKALAEKKLSEDLYYRLSASTVYVPPLKELIKRSSSEDAHGLKSLVRNAKEEAEKRAMAGALEQTHWNRKAAARLLCISYRALLYKIQEYGMSPPETIPSVCNK